MMVLELSPPCSFLYTQHVVFLLGEAREKEDGNQRTLSLSPKLQADPSGSQGE